VEIDKNFGLEDRS